MAGALSQKLRAQGGNQTGQDTLPFRARLRTHTYTRPDQDPLRHAHSIMCTSLGCEYLGKHPCRHGEHMQTPETVALDSNLFPSSLSRKDTEKNLNSRTCCICGKCQNIAFCWQFILHVTNIQHRLTITLGRARIQVLSLHGAYMPVGIFLNTDNNFRMAIRKYLYNTEMWILLDSNFN